MNVMHSIRIPLRAAAALLCTVAAPLLADVKAGVDAWSRGDYAAALREWRAPAEQGDADAQFNLGQAYKLGRGVTRDLARAEALFAKASAQGHLQASDNLGLLLFQRGERERALPYLTSAADRGDPRAQYLLGIAHFNGDGVAKDWPRAYALVNLAQQAGLPQAAPALAQMDSYIPLEQRQLGVAMAGDLAVAAQANRARQTAAADLGNGLVPSATPDSSLAARAATSAAATAAPPRPAGGTIYPAGRQPAAAPAATPARSMAAAPATDRPASPDAAIAAATRIAGSESPRSAGADYTRPAITTPASAPAPGPAPAIAIAPTVADAPAARTTAPPRTAPAPSIAARPATAAAARVAASPVPASSAARPVLPRPAVPAAATPPAARPRPAAAGPWRVQLGAFSVAANIDALWNRVRTRPELAGHPKLLVAAGPVTKLQAGGFASQADAQAACTRLTGAGFSCIPARN